MGFVFEVSAWVGGCRLESVFSPLAAGVCALHCPAGRESFMNPNLRAVEEGAGPSDLSAKVQNSNGACVLVSEQFHVEHLRVRVCCVLDL